MSDDYWDEEIKILKDRIEALDAEMKLVMEINERLLAVLRKIGEGDVCVSLMTYPAQCGRAYQARAALAGEKKDAD